MPTKIPFPRVPQNLLVPAVVVALAGVSFFAGTLWQKVNYLEQGAKVGSANLNAQPVAGSAPSQPSNPLQAVKADTLNLVPVTDEDHVRGNKNAQLTWVEYSDLQCPYCKKIHPDLVQALKEYDGKLRWVYRHYPLDTPDASGNVLHPKARAAAEITECVASVGGDDKFWQFIDKIFDPLATIAILEPDQLVRLAGEVGVNSAQVKTCLDSGQFAQRVKDDQAGGTKAGVNGTPGSFLLNDKGNAWLVNGAMPYASLKQVIDQALQN